MASCREFLDFILSQVSDLGADVSWRKMMGEYIIYYRGKIIGGIYDNRFLVKSAKSVMQNIRGEMVAPYDSGKPMFLITDVENRDTLCLAIKMVYDEFYT